MTAARIAANIAKLPELTEATFLWAGVLGTAREVLFQFQLAAFQNGPQKSSASIFCCVSGESRWW
jgi:hypothetical protein